MQFIITGIKEVQEERRGLITKFTIRKKKITVKQSNGDQNMKPSSSRFQRVQTNRKEKAN
ncbi:hypothetical protein [Virgibacillus sp. Bac332]|uniref:hypothetical protein n=1 Tax=Virgibacillus sp. Bac332 TaxID=2419842 RepID=UPI0013CE8BA2|nr:hypothetical protein [Virgibacillus sp. Bac332]QRZ18684.1 hypothetical protein JUJ52_02730 [Virgibacillus sp. AGTR]